MSTFVRTEIVVHRYYKDKQTVRKICLPENNSSGFFGEMQLVFDSGQLVSNRVIFESLPITKIEAGDSDANL